MCNNTINKNDSNDAVKRFNTHNTQERIKMSNMNPFEVRLEVLKMAQGMVEQTYNEANQMAWSMVEKVAEHQNKSMAEMKEFLDGIKPMMYTPSDIIKKAEELYQFVTNKEQTTQK
jgi:hypothetical protein